MKLRSLIVRRYGPLVDREFELDEDLILVYGPNEAGKTSFRACLETLLYGYEPARRDLHPLAGPDAKADLHVEGLIDPGGETLAVERVLQDRGRLRTARRGEPFHGPRRPNHALPLVEGVPRALFNSVYALSSADLIALEGDVRSHVDELLLGEKAVPNLRPTFRVRDELAQAQSGLWRVDNRGKPRARVLRDAIKTARQDLARAKAEERELRDALVEKERLEARVQKLRKKKLALEHEADEAAFLAQLADLRARKLAAQELDLTPLEGRPLTDPEFLAREIRALEEKVAEPRARLERLPLALTTAEARVLEEAPAQEARREAFGRHQRDLEGLEETRAETERLERRASARLADLLGRPPTPRELEVMADFRVHALGLAHEAWTADWEDFQTALFEQPRDPGLPFALVLGICGAILVLLASTATVKPTIGIWGLLLISACFAIALRRMGRRDLPDRPPRNADFDALTADLGVDPALAPTPATARRLVIELENLVETSSHLNELQGRVFTQAEKLEEREEEWARDAEELGLPVAINGIENFTRLQAALTSARQRQAAVDRDAAERAQATTLIRAHAGELDDKRDLWQRLTGVLRANAPDAVDWSAAYRTLLAREKERTIADELERRLRSDERFDALHTDPRLTPVVQPLWHAREVERRSLALATIETELAEAALRLGELQEKLRSDPGSRVARALEELEESEAELGRVERKRDRLALLGAVLAEADREFRARNQPDVLRRASNYLKTITGGRYTRLDYHEGDQSRLFVQPQGADEPNAVEPPLSRGTRDQIYLAVRLGLLDHLDEGRGALPLLLDEALVHWDAERRGALYTLLPMVAEHRQVFILTCHDAIAGEVEEALKIKRIDLGSPEAHRVGPGVLFDHSRRTAGEGAPSDATAAVGEDEPSLESQEADLGRGE